MSLRQAIVFAILMGADLAEIAPPYLMEKLRACQDMLVPEGLLGGVNTALFLQYVASWPEVAALGWDKEKDLNRPMSELREEQVR